MTRTLRLLAVALLVAGLLPASPATAKKRQGQNPGQMQPQGQPQGQSYGSPGYAGPKGDNGAPPYGPPSYAGPKAGNQNMNQPNLGMPGPMNQGPGNQPRKYKKGKQHGPPDHAPAWGYRNQQ